MKIALLFFILYTSWSARADLTPSYLSIELTADKNSFASDEILQWNINFKNTGNRSYGILLPGNRNHGNRLIYFSYYYVQDNLYTEVSRESASLAMDTTVLGYHDFKYIPAQETLSIPMFMNDVLNYSHINAAHHKIPDLTPGTYQVLAWYVPFDVERGELYFNLLHGFGNLVDSTYSNERFTIPEEGLISNYMSIEIKASPTSDVYFEPTVFCPKNCKLCEAVEASNWSEVEAIIDDQTYYTKAIDRRFIDSSWQQPHRNIAFLYHGPDVILASLPTYTSRRIVFQNASGYHYYDLTWQIGLIYPGRSRFYLIKRLFAPLRIDIPTENHDFYQLVRFERYR